MPEMFQLDDRELKQLLKFYKNAPKQFLAASAGMLNTFAFGVRDNAHQELKNKLTVRADGFVKSSIRVQKTRIVPLANQEAITGSVIRPRFSGWVEQETGEKTKRTRIQTLAGRQGNWQNKLPSGARLKSSSFFYRDEDFASKFSKTRGQRTAAMLNMIRKGKVKNKPVILRHRLKGNMANLKRGTYRLGTDKMFHREQNFNPKKLQPKRNPWMQPARDKYFKQVNLQNLWAHQINRVLKYP